MPPAPLTVGLLLGATSIAGLVGLAIDPSPFSASSGILVGAGTTLAALIGVTGLLLARGRWARWWTILVAATWLGVAASGPTDLDLAATAVLAATTVGASSGPWLGRWLRRLPVADGVPVAAAVALLALAASPAITGLVSGPDDPGAAGWAIGAWSLVLAGLMARGIQASLWLARFVHLPLVLGLGLVMPTPRGVLMAVPAAVVAGAAWRRDVGAAIRPLIARPADAVPIPPELVDPGIMRAAGLDDRGRPLEDP